ncbi:15801_t:CDS:2, partial [Dentiscutata erythropus]
NSKEAAISAVNAFQGSVCDAFLIVGLKEPLRISVIHKIADEVVINKAFDLQNSIIIYLDMNGVEQDIKRAIDAAEYLYKYKKYEDAWNIYSELAKTDNIKLDALKQMANYYNNEHVKKDERLIFEIALELYSKKQYKDAYNIFLKLTNSNDSEIKLITIYIKASYYITGYNDVRKNKNKAIELIKKDITQS